MTGSDVSRATKKIVEQSKGTCPTEELVLDADDPVDVAVDEDPLASVAAAQAAVELLASTAASTSSCVPLKGVVENPHSAALELSSPP